MSSGRCRNKELQISMEPSDEAASVARAAADRLANDFGQRLSVEVEGVIYDEGSERPPEQYVDPISVASLVVSIASLAWTICQDIRKQGRKPSSGTLTRRVRLATQPTPT